MSTFENGLRHALVNPLNLLFLGLQLAFFVYAYRRMRKNNSEDREFVRVAPERLTGIGILGTFTGIFVGLVQFDISKIDESLPRLLEGLTTAFVASVAGLTLALVLRFLFEQQRSRATASLTGSPIDDLRRDLVQLRQAVIESKESNSAGLEALRRAIGGDESGNLATHIRTLQEAVGGGGDNTLVSQVRLMRQDQNDNAKEAGRRFDEFSRQVSELGSKALVEALRDVIADFNEKLTEQFGENFKELNSAVRELVTWQDRYRDQVEQMGAQFAACVSGIDQARLSLDAIATSSQSIPPTMRQLADIVGSVQSQQSILEAQLLSFADLGRQAVEAMPRIESNLATLVSGFSATVGESLRQLSEAETAQRSSMEKMSKTYDQLRESIGKASAAQDEHLRSILAELSSAHSSLDTQLREVQQQALKSWRAGFDQSVKEQSELMAQQVANLDTALGSEMQKALSQLSQHLLGLHEKLVSDYTPLTERLRKLVAVAETNRS